MPRDDDEDEVPKGQPEWRIDADAESLEEDPECRNSWNGYHPPIEPGDTLTLRFSNPDAENGYGNGRGPLSWLNSARVVLDPDEDSVYFSASIFDPRGGFGFTVRRLRGSGKGDPEDNRGIIVIHTPYQGAGFQHQPVRHIRAGTVEVIHDPDLPQLPDEGELLREAVAMLREALPARRRIAVGPAASSFWRQIREWEHVRDLMAAAKPCRVAVHDDEEE